MNRRHWKLALLALGSILLALNLAGAVGSLRSAALRPELTMFAQNLELTADEVLGERSRRPGESDDAYIARLTSVVHRGMGHFWPEAGGARFNLTVPATENFLLHLGTRLRPDIYERYEFTTPEKALERGVGLCSQFALVMEGLLERVGIKARIVGLGGHVVVEARTRAGSMFIADADYGVVLPYSVRQVEANPDLATPYYAQARRRTVQTGSPPAEIAALYGPAGNQQFDGAADYAPKIHLIERWAYIGKWLLPLMMLAASVPRSAGMRRRLAHAAPLHPPAENLVYRRFGKRLLDIAASFAALLVLAPILAAVALAVRAFLGTPVLFRQQRPGLHGRPFMLYKFRTMRSVPAGEEVPDHLRLTRFGQWLRSTSLDELPELWNVLRGEMSIVGPRPLLTEYLPLYSAVQARRHEVPPGITGWAQVNGRNAVSWEDKFRLDVWYVDNVSLDLDVRILAATVRSVVRREGISQTGHVTAERFTGSVE